MQYHINEKTGNPNVCRSKTCELPHFATKEEALASKTASSETLAEKAEHAVEKVREELAEDKAARSDFPLEVTESKGGSGKTTAVANLTAALAKEEAVPSQQVPQPAHEHEPPLPVAAAEVKPIVETPNHVDGPVAYEVGPEMATPGRPVYAMPADAHEHHEGPCEHRREKGKTKKAVRKERARALAQDAVAAFDRLAKEAPHHPLVKRGKKAFKKFRK